MDLPNTNNTHNNADAWDWQGEDNYQPRESACVPQCFWDDDNQYEDSMFYMLGDHTPIKDCSTFSLDDLDLEDKTSKVLEGTECRSSQVKRRRTLQFTSDVDDNPPTGDHQPATTCNKLVEEESTIEALPEISPWDSQLCSDFLDDGYLYSNEVLDPSSNGWIQNYFDEGKIHENTSQTFSTMTDYVDADHQTGRSASEKNDVVTKTPNIQTSILKIFKGTQSLFTPGTNLATSVACPFTFIKPSGLQGNLTLEDINQRIHPPAPRLKHKKDDDPYLSYPTSSFSGKPVVAKTKIRTEGGKGSITILRTKG